MPRQITLSRWQQKWAIKFQSSTTSSTSLCSRTTTSSILAPMSSWARVSISGVKSSDSFRSSVRTAYKNLSGLMPCIDCNPKETYNKLEELSNTKLGITRIYCNYLDGYHAPSALIFYPRHSIRQPSCTLAIRLADLMESEYIANRILSKSFITSRVEKIEFCYDISLILWRYSVRKPNSNLTKTHSNRNIPLLIMQ